jgi:hypothetical protein
MERFASCSLRSAEGDDGQHHSLYARAPTCRISNGGTACPFHSLGCSSAADRKCRHRPRSYRRIPCPRWSRLRSLADYLCQGDAGALGTCRQRWPIPSRQLECSIGIRCEDRVRLCHIGFDRRCARPDRILPEEKATSRAPAVILGHGESIRRSVGLRLEEASKVEYRLTVRLFEDGEFPEGVRAPGRQGPQAALVTARPCRRRRRPRRPLSGAAARRRGVDLREPRAIATAASHLARTRSTQAEKASTQPCRNLRAPIALPCWGHCPLHGADAVRARTRPWWRLELRICQRIRY